MHNSCHYHVRSLSSEPKIVVKDFIKRGLTMSDNSIMRSIRKHVGDFKPEIGIIAGSGLGALADNIENKIVIPYTAIDDFIDCSVKGHAGEFHFGTLHDVPVVCLKGRLHYYEGVSNHKMKLLPLALSEQSIKSSIAV
jgi:purine nucleoside phosphorylase